MKIKINYESKYSFSTKKNGDSIMTGMGVLTQNANKSTKEIFKKENTYLENIKELNKYYPNYKYSDITDNTILGILCRLVGEVRRLDSLKIEHPIISLKDKISFKNFNKTFQNEVILLHTPLKEVQNNAGGLVSADKSDHFLLNKNNLSETLLNVFTLKEQDEIIDLLRKMSNNDMEVFYSQYKEDIKINTFVKEMLLAEEKHKNIIQGFYFKSDDIVWKEIDKRLFKGKEFDINHLEKEVLNNIDNKKFSIKEEIKELEVEEIFNIYGVLFAQKIEFLKRNNLFKKEFEKYLNSRNSIKGLAPSSGGLTVKDYFNNFVDGKKMSWTMPYQVDVKKELFKKDDWKDFNTSAKLGITKESGYIEIYINVDKEEALKLYEMIENAGVNTFHLGKKGLAYIENIELE